MDIAIMVSLNKAKAIMKKECKIAKIMKAFNCFLLLKYLSRVKGERRKKTFTLLD